MHQAALFLALAIFVLLPGSAMCLDASPDPEVLAHPSHAELFDMLLQEAEIELLMKKGYAPLLCKPIPRPPYRPGKIEWVWESGCSLWLDDWSMSTFPED